jgi:hypothetical protein
MSEEDFWPLSVIGGRFFWEFCLLERLRPNNNLVFKRVMCSFLVLNFKVRKEPKKKEGCCFGIFIAKRASYN